MEDPSSYVLNEKQYFIIHDYFKEGNFLSYMALGKEGKENINTDINLQKFEAEGLSIVENQIFYKGVQLTQDPSLKKKPILVNDCEVYFLSDRRARRAAFTLKKINICNLR